MTAFIGALCKWRRFSDCSDVKFAFCTASPVPITDSEWSQLVFNVTTCDCHARRHNSKFPMFNMCGSVAEWLGRWTCDQQVASSPGLAAIECNPGQIVNTHVPLSPSSIIWYQPCGLKITVGLASHWPCDTDNSGITTYGLLALEREMSIPPKLQ